jgi:MarR family transcriptional regulator, 2-MHQ and catechol-resistance regulon repressor
MPTHYEGTDEERSALDLYIKLLRAAEAVSRRALTDIVAAGLTEGQFGVLEALHHLGPMRLSDLAAKHLRSPNNLTVIVDNLEKAELVRREPDTKDRRVIFVHLTPLGKECIVPLFPIHTAAVVRELSVLSSSESALLGELLKKIGVREKST